MPLILEPCQPSSIEVEPSLPCVPGALQEPGCSDGPGPGPGVPGGRALARAVPPPTPQHGTSPFCAFRAHEKTESCALREHKAAVSSLWLIFER